MSLRLSSTNHESPGFSRGERQRPMSKDSVLSLHLIKKVAGIPATLTWMDKSDSSMETAKPEASDGFNRIN